MAQNPKTVLIVDDNPDVSTVVTLCLRSAGFHVIQAEDGETGHKLAMREKPALILLDEQMPRMNGEVMLAKLRENPATAPIPVVMIGGSGQVHEAEWQARGAFALLAKPFQFHELLAVVAKALTPSLA